MNDAIGRQDISSTDAITVISPRGQRTRLTPFSPDMTIPLTLTVTTAALLFVLSSGSALAAGSRAAVEAKPGEIVLLRSVPARPAARTMPPGRALLIDPSPESEMEQGLSQLEISAGGYGQVAAGAGNGRAAPSGLGGSITSITQQLGGSTHGRHSAPSAAGGSIGAATGSIGSTVTGALSGAGLLGQGGQR